MTQCENCKHQWTWSTTLRKSFTLGDGMQCTECGATQYLTKKSRKKVGISNLIPAPILILSAWFFDVEIITVITLALLLFATYMMLYPFMVDLTSDKEPLW